jgi:hypothetical protein
VLGSHISAVVRLCEVALEAGIDLRGAVFRLSGEPVTAGRAAFIRRVGARILVRYAATETGVLGRSCLLPTELDDLHFATERMAVIQPGQEGGGTGLPADALLLTSLLPSARLILVNVSLGDQAVVSRRPCGCPMERLGASTHLHTIRSFEKLTAGGMTFFDADVVRVLDEVLPARFGGSPTDYQLVDEETTSGSPSVRLRVHPRLGPLDESVVREAFLEAMGPGDGAARIMAQVWRDAGLPLIERTQSMATASGKIQHVYHHRPATELAGEVRSPQHVT